ncbi:MAG: hypothetical protein KJN93_09420 [Alphaproteobacteria bacterium]|nr:hypothetical protein [Alphaproteobacteria bacterium]NNF23569.1 hypothetical protein [Paracoccaceae bacterium]
MIRPAVLFLLWSGPCLAADITGIPAGQMRWERTPAGVAFAALNGDRFAEPYMAMVALPAGLVSPAHVKSADMFGLVVSGTMTHVPQGFSPQEGTAIGPGGFYHIPAELPHVSSCISKEDCVTFLYQPGAFDFRPMAP